VGQNTCIQVSVNTGVSCDKLLEQTAVCKGNLPINWTPKYHGLYIILQKIVLAWDGKVWTFLQELEPLVKFAYSKSTWCFKRILHPDKTLYKPCEILYYWKLSVFYITCAKMLTFRFIPHLHFLMLIWISSKSNRFWKALQQENQCHHYQKWNVEKFLTYEFNIFMLKILPHSILIKMT